MRRIAFALLLFCLAAGAGKITPKEVGASKLSFELQWVLEGEPPFSLKTFGFNNYSFQTVSFHSSDEFEEGIDEHGNAQLTFHLPDSSKRLLKLSGSAELDYSNGFEPAANTEDFLTESAFVELTPEITGKARQLTREARNDFEAMVLLADWVHNNVAYDESYGSQQCGSTEVFEGLRGTCDEYSHLLIAFARALGIPARFTAGFVHSGGSWGAHAWVEFEFEGEWIPVDPTFNEFALLDATHLKFAHGKDQEDIAQEVTEGVGVQVAAPEFELHEKQGFDLPFEYSFYQLPEEVGAGAAIDARVAVNSLSQRHSAAPLSMIVPTEPAELAVKTVGNADKLVYLAPSERKVVEWRLVFPHSLQEGYSYNYSVRVESFDSFDEKIIRGGSGDSDKVSSAEVHDFSARLENGGGLLVFEVANAGNTVYSANASCILEGETQTKKTGIPVGESVLLQFVFDDPEKEVLEGELSLSNGHRTLKQPFQVSLEQAPAASKESGEAFPYALAAAGILALAAAFHFHKKNIN